MSSATSLVSETERTGSAAKAWLRALELTAPIPRHPRRTLPAVIEERAAALGDAPALLSDAESYTYAGLAARTRQYARWALGQGIGDGGTVGLLMPNRPEYMAAWLGVTSVGGVVALLNTSLTGASLAHCIRTAGARQLIVAEQYVGAVRAASLDAPVLWTHGGEDQARRLEVQLAEYSAEPLSDSERRLPSIADLALYIYTSGTTGLPKAAKVSHARVMQWTHWFAGMMQLTAEDRVYNTLPMYHSVGGVQAPGAALVAGASVVTREKFSASQFWPDVVRWDATVVQYIGELCRYLVRTPVRAEETQHRLRMACGNGLAPEVWEQFEARFRIPQILEFYASTEGGLSLFNAEGKRGAIGRVPPYLAHRFSPVLIRIDAETGEPERDASGLCIRAAPGESGEALSRVTDDPAQVGSRFEGYTDRAATERRLLRDVLAPGDCWLRSGDLMRQDEKRFFFFVDRLGDTFRWKGENVSTLEIAEVIAGYPGVEDALVYGVRVPGADGRVGMATITADRALNLDGLRQHLRDRLPSYARPLFLRLRDQAAEVTGTFKYQKSELVREGYNPSRVADRLLFDHPAVERFVPLDPELFAQINEGRVRI